MITRKTATSESIRLSERDVSMLRLLSREGYRFLTCRHLAGLAFGSEPACERRLSTLLRAGLVLRLFLPFTQKGIRQEPIYTLDRKGARTLARITGESPASLYSPLGPTSYLFLAHQLAVSDIRYALAMATRADPDVRLLGWLDEWELRRARGRAYRVRNPADPGATIPVIPDAAFGLSIDGQRNYYFLEADRGTMGRAAMERKFWGYVQFFRDGLHRSAFGFPHFRVLIVTTTPARRDRLTQLVRNLGFTPNMFLFTTYTEIIDGATVANVSPERILGDILHKCNNTELHSLLD